MHRSDAAEAAIAPLPHRPLGCVPARVPGAICLALSLLTAACVSPAAVSPAAVPAGAQPVIYQPVVYVIHRGWHTDVGLPVTEIAQPLASLETRFPGVRFLTFGFGERQFLVGRKPGVLTMLRALLPSRSALLMTALSATPRQAFGERNVVALRVSRAGLDQLQARLWQMFETQGTSQPVPLAPGPYTGSEFYPARPIYNGFYTCNTWTAETLRSAGLPMPAGVLFAGQVMGMARWIDQQQAQASVAALPSAPAAQ